MCHFVVCVYCECIGEEKSKESVVRERSMEAFLEKLLLNIHTHPQSSSSSALVRSSHPLVALVLSTVLPQGCCIYSSVMTYSMFSTFKL